MSYYYELRWPLSKADNKRNCVHMSEEEVKLLKGYLIVLQNEKASFEKIKLPILYDLYAYNNEELDHYTDSKKAPQRTKFGSLNKGDFLL